MPMIELPFTTADDPYTESAYAGGMDICGFHCSSLGNSAAFLEVQVALNWNKFSGDAGATWETLRDKEDAIFQYPVAVGATRAIRWNPADMLIVERFRFRCVIAAGTDSNQQTGSVKLMMGKIRGA